MSMKILKDAQKNWAKNYMNAIDYRSKHSVIGDNIVVLPWPVFPKTELELPETVKMNELTNYFDQHPDQALVVMVDPYFRDNYIVSGTFLIPSSLKEDNLVQLRAGRLVVPLIYKGTTMFVIKPSDILTISKNQYQNEQSGE